MRPVAFSLVLEFAITICKVAIPHPAPIVVYGDSV